MSQRDIDKLKELFVADVDEETRAENLRLIEDWEKGLRENQAFKSWEGHPITIEIAATARKTFVDASITLATNRELTEPARVQLWAQKDAALWILSLMEPGGAAQLASIQQEISQALTTATRA